MEIGIVKYVGNAMPFEFALDFANSARTKTAPEYKTASFTFACGICASRSHTLCVYVWMQLRNTWWLNPVI